MSNVLAATEKRCPRCHLTKPVSKFNSDKSRKSGIFPICRACYRKIDFGRTRPEEYNAKHRIAKNIRIMNDPSVALKEKAREKAHIHKNKIKKSACENCGAKEKLHMHHPDYSKPLEVITLCRPCHDALHYGAAL